MQLNGLSMSDFKNQTDALKTADALIKQNQKEFEHDGGVEEVKGFPLLHKYFFVDSHGKKRVWTSTEKKTLSGERDVKSRKELSDSSVFKEALGDKSPSKASGIKEENEALSMMVKDKETLRSVLRAY